MPRTAVTLRRVTCEDAVRLYQWRTDAETVAMSDQAPPHSYADHLAWLTRRLTTSRPNLFIGMDDQDAVGTIRVDREYPAVGVLSVTVAPAVRRRGYATGLIRALCEHPCVADVVLLRATIKREIVASERAFARAGFIRTGGTATHRIYEWPVHHATQR